MWHRLNSYKTTLQCHVESHSSSSSSRAQMELYHASGTLREKSSVLNSRLKAGRVVDEIMSTGRAFQTRAATTGKARSPTVDSRDVGTAKVSEDHDRLSIGYINLVNATHIPRRIADNSLRNKSLNLQMNFFACLLKCLFLQLLDHVKEQATF